jgi:hypothetical protein
MEEYNKPAKLKHPHSEPLKKGTKITYRGANRKPQGDLADFRKVFQKYPVISEKSYRKAFRDPSYALFQITNNNVYPVNKLKYKRFPFAFLEPNPITFYYSIANDIIRDYTICHENLSTIIKEKIDPNMKGTRLARVFAYLYKVNSIAVTFLTMSLEAFANQELPDFNILPDGSKMNRNKIEQYESLVRKLKKHVTKINQKNFATIHPKRMERIESLISLRNEIVHLKKIEGSGITRYESLYQKMLDFKLNSLLFDVKSYINFYHPKLIVNYRL